MVRYVAFLVLGSAFVTGIVTTVQTHRLFTEPMVPTSAPANYIPPSTPASYVDDHWPSSVPITFKVSVSR
jgi:hypothetical protein